MRGAKFGLSCPMSSGPNVLKWKGKFPDGAKPPPFVTINSHVEYYNGDGSKLACVEFPVKYTP